MVWDGEEWRLPAPLNALRPPDAKVDVMSAGSNRVQVLALLVWPRDRAQVVPAELQGDPAAVVTADAAVVGRDGHRRRPRHDECRRRNRDS